MGYGGIGCEHYAGVVVAYGGREGGGVAGVDIPISSSRLLHLQRGDRGQNTLPSSYFDWNANIIWLEIVHLQDFITLKLKNKNVFIYVLQEQSFGLSKCIK